MTAIPIGEAEYRPGLEPGVVVDPVVVNPDRASLHSQAVLLTCRGVVGPVIRRYPITPDIRLRSSDENTGAILEEMLAAFADCPISRLDGVRIDLGDGWALARSSVTEPLITLRFEAHSQARLREIQELVRRRVPRLAKIWAL